MRSLRAPAALTPLRRRLRAAWDAFCAAPDPSPCTTLAPMPEALAQQIAELHAPKLVADAERHLRERGRS